MKKLILIAIFALTSLIVFESYNFVVPKNECDIAKFYSAIIPDDYNTKVLTKMGSIEEVEAILVPTKLDPGTYKVKISRKATNLYEIESANIWIETNYCYEYSYWKEVILVVESSYGYSKGKILFE